MVLQTSAFFSTLSWAPALFTLCWFSMFLFGRTLWSAVCMTFAVVVVVVVVVLITVVIVLFVDQNSCRSRALFSYAIVFAWVARGHWIQLRWACNHRILNYSKKKTSISNLRLFSKEIRIFLFWLCHQQPMDKTSILEKFIPTWNWTCQIPVNEWKYCVEKLFSQIGWMLNNCFNEICSEKLWCSLAPAVVYSVTKEALLSAARIATTE